MEQKLSKLLLPREPNTPPPTRADIDECYTAMVDEIAAQVERALEMGESSIFDALKVRLDDFRSELSRSIRAITRKSMWDIIVKLRDDQDVGREEMDMIRLWMVGDAEAYIKEENNFDDWVDELARLEKEVRAMREGPVAVDRIAVLRALLTDARGVARSIARFLDYRDRVQRYETSISDGLDASAREVLANILVRKYNDGVDL